MFSLFELKDVVCWEFSYLWLGRIITLLILPVELVWTSNSNWNDPINQFCRNDNHVTFGSQWKTWEMNNIFSNLCAFIIYLFMSAYPISKYRHHCQQGGGVAGEKGLTCSKRVQKVPPWNYAKRIAREARSVAFMREHRQLRVRSIYRERRCSFSRKPYEPSAHPYAWCGGAVAAYNYIDTKATLSRASSLLLFFFGWRGLSITGEKGQGWSSLRLYRRGRLFCW